jgi:hypothetical protein
MDIYDFAEGLSKNIGRNAIRFIELEQYYDGYNL